MIFENINEKVFLIFFIIVLLAGNSIAAKLVGIFPVDNQCLMIHFQDAMVEYNWDDTISGPCNEMHNFYTGGSCPDRD